MGVIVNFLILSGLMFALITGLYLGFKTIKLI